MQRIKQVAGLVLMGAAALLLAYTFWIWVSFDEQVPGPVFQRFGGVFQMLSEKGLLQVVHFGRLVAQGIVGVALIKWGFSLFKPSHRPTNDV
ncbi:MAG: hypothetical protein NXI17_23690 [Alphaproteobacteria bacterium]|nr:hypothetical protein [Alphaproteobacteria bacterium]